MICVLEISPKKEAATKTPSPDLKELRRSISAFLMVTHPEIQLRNFAECYPRNGGGIVVLNNEYAICIKNKFLSISFHLIKLDKIKVNLLNVNQTKPKSISRRLQPRVVSLVYICTSDSLTTNTLT